MDQLVPALNRLEAAIDRLETAALTRLNQDHTNVLASDEGVAERDAVLDDLGRRLDRSIAHLRAALGS